MSTPLLSFAQPLTLAALAAALRSGEPQRLPAETEARLRAPYPPEATPTAPWLLAHACGTGPEVPPELVRRLLLLKAHALSQAPGSPLAAAARRLLDFYNREVWPVVYEQGPPATPLAHLSLPLLGQGDVNYQGYRLAAADVLELLGWKPLTLEVPAAQQLLVGNELALAYATEALERATHLQRATVAIAALSQAAGPMDPASGYETLAPVAQVVEAACHPGAATPAGQLPLALGWLARTVADMGQAAARRTGSLLPPAPAAEAAALAALPGVAASLASHGQRLSGGAPTPPDVRHVVENTEQLLGIELLAAAQAFDLRRPARSSPAQEAVVAAFRGVVTFADHSRVLAPDLHRAARFVREYEWA